MKRGLTHIIFVVDRSGSMRDIAQDMVGGYNTFIEKQKETPGECFVSFYQFNDIYETVFERKALTEVPILDEKTYVPRNMTALHDAIGKTVNNYGTYLSALKEEERPERVLVIIITDGFNNASREFTLESVREIIKHQTEVYSWDFVFMGSNIDAWKQSEAYGIASSSTSQFANCAGSVSASWAAASANAICYRASDHKIAYCFSAEDREAQDKFLDGDLKSKNLAQAKIEKQKKTK